MKHTTRLAPALVLCWAVACGDDPVENADATVAADAAEADGGIEAEAGFPDADPPDAGRADGGAPPEAGVSWNEVSCKACSECANGLCLTNAARESFCADRCDADPTGCVTGFTCTDIGPEGSPAFFCIPPAASCRAEGTGSGSACYGDNASCLALQDHCEGDVHALGYCTNTCTDDQDCPNGFLCSEGDENVFSCRPRYLTDAEACARVFDVDEIACSVDEECTDYVPGTVCVRSEPTLPGVCALPCSIELCGAGSCYYTSRGDVCLTDRCACHGSVVASDARDLLAEALGAAGISRCGTIFRVFDWASVPNDVLTDPYRLSFYDRVHNEPLYAPSWAEGVVEQFDTEADAMESATARAARMIEHLADLVDRPVMTRAPNPLDPVEPLANAVADLITEAGGVPDLAALTSSAAAIPMDLQLALAGVVEAMQRGVVARRQAISLAPGSLDNLYNYGAAFVAQRSDGLGLAPANAGTRRLLSETYGYGAMYGAATDLLDAIAVADLARFAVPTTSTIATEAAALLFSADTPIGRIAVGGSEDGIYDPRDAGFEGAWALLVDLGGADEYRIPVAGNISTANSVSVMIDLGGRDRYGYVEVPHPLDGARLPSDEGGRYTPGGPVTEDYGPISFSQVPRQGGARVGTAIHVDLGTDADHYRSLRMSQGSGIFGAGVLVDEGGDDIYELEAMGQGAGSFGLGLLFDVAGNDVRRAYTEAQGFAFAAASGLLYDIAGDDQYLMDAGDPTVGGDPLYFNAQRPGRANSTLGQGFGFGRRADFSDRAFMSGGVGLLIDRTGGDRYRGSIFAQGGGFWFGTGILADHRGNDSYDGLWYAMSTGAHYALSFLLEGEGNDTYGGELPRVNVTIAGGHDYSAAFLIDEAGDDRYRGSRITIGGGNSNGMGFFADNGGDDVYDAIATYSFGAAGLVGADVDFPGSPRRRMNVVGIFLDAGGNDTYTRMDQPVEGFIDGGSWVQFVNTSSIVNAIERGAGIDGIGDSSLHFRL